MSQASTGEELLDLTSRSYQLGLSVVGLDGLVILGDLDGLIGKTVSLHMCVGCTMICGNSRDNGSAGWATEYLLLPEVSFPRACPPTSQNPLPEHCLSSAPTDRHTPRTAV